MPRLRARGVRGWELREVSKLQCCVRMDRHLELGKHYGLCPRRSARKCGTASDRSVCMRSRFGVFGKKLKKNGAVEGRLDVMSPPKGDGVPLGVSSVNRHVLILFLAGSWQDVAFCDKMTNLF